MSAVYKLCLAESPKRFRESEKLNNTKRVVTTAEGNRNAHNLPSPKAAAENAASQVGRGGFS